MWTLYYATGTVALAPHIALEEAGADYVATRLNFQDNEQRKAPYLAVNPKARVPSFVTERGVITETPAILAFIAQSFPKAKLAPFDDPFEFARLQAFNVYLAATVHVAHAHYRRGARWADEAEAHEAMRRRVPGNMADCFDLIERTMFAGPWVMGETYTIADPYLFTIARWLESDEVDPSRFPKVADHRQRMAERPAVKKVLAVWAA